MRKLLAPAAALAVLALALVPHAAPSLSNCDQDAARNLMASDLLDAYLNPTKQEDYEFFTVSSSVPNIMFVIDTSGSMQRLPPDGPASLAGSAKACTTAADCPTWYVCGGAGYCTPTLPGANAAGTSLLYSSLISNFTDATQQTNAFDSTTRVVGCDADPTFNATPNVHDNPMLMEVMARRFYSPCGSASDPTAIGDPYRGHVGLVTGGLDYPAQMSVCPYYTSSNSQATGHPGFDPDFYPTSPSGTETTANGQAVFFGRDLVIHDNDYFGFVTNDPWVPYLYAYDNSLAFKHNFGNGWTGSAVSPVAKGNGNNSIATIADFCAQQGSALQGGAARSAICTTCLQQKGWYWDGVILQDSQGNRYPSLWYTGNYLSFYPPKFVISRKIVKDEISVVSKVRMSVAHFNYPSGLNFGLDKDFNPTCDHPDSSFDSNRGSYVTAVNALTNFSSGTPLANALFDVGRYYHSPNLPWFGSTWDIAAKDSASNSNSYAICYSCQTSSVVFLTDGEPTAGDGSGLPSGTKTTTLTDANGTGGSPAKYAGDTTTGILGITSTTCPQCANFSGANAWKDDLAKVAWYMHNMDLRDNSEVTRDCRNNGGKQVLNTYMVGFATGQVPDANTILSASAKAGGGLFIQADNASALRSGLDAVINDISTRSTSFSVATVSTLQTTAGRAVIVPRFEPSRAASWHGHLLRFDLYSEFVNACNPKPDGTGVGDLDCDGACSSVFLEDKRDDPNTPSFVTEDGAGNFVRASPGNTPVCSQAPRCQTTSGKTCSAAGSSAAIPWWDAGAVLSGTSTTQKWKSRYVYTVTDSNGDGVIDASDTVIRLQATDTVADAIIPYLGLGQQNVCTNLSTQFATAGDLPHSLTVLSSQRECAKAIIRLVLGADLFNSQNAKTGYPAASLDDLWDRDWTLGDIFHSSPVVIDPPLPRDGVICPNGLSNQCLPSLWLTPTKGGQNGYDGYSKSTTYVNRNKVVLVGANDGLLHAFLAGTWNGNPTPGVHNSVADDPSTTTVDESLPPFNGFYDRGTGQELWAFLPPDMMAKLPLILSGGHQFFVDGNPMVRDVWVDGTGNALGSAVAADDVKQAQEFHTVAVTGERRGGNHFFALDVTDATTAGAQPGFLWIYPQPNSPEQLDFGETYNDYLPRASPIGPVRIQADAQGGAANSNTPLMADTGVAYHERWVAYLNGGFDPSYLRGRGVHMVDVWTGKELFDFSYSSDTTNVRNALRFPVASAVGLTGWGKTAKRASDETDDYLFDTATFGDTGGQLWVVRFHDPGVIDATTGKVGNWFGGRIFQMGTSSQACKLCAGQPFFYMTANIPLPTNGAYRVYAGTGDRFNLLDVNGGTCGPDNIRACVLQGCTVTLDQTANVLESAELGSAARGLSQVACNAMTSTQTDSTPATCVMNGKTKIAITACPAQGSNPNSSTKDIEVACTNTTTSTDPTQLGYQCSAVVNVGGQKLPALSNAITLGNMFYSLLVFEDTGNRAIFTDATSAATYDTNRLWLNETGLDASNRLQATYSTGIVPIAASDTAPTTLADATSKGWVLYYNRGPTATADNTQYQVYWADERTSSGTATLGGIYWNTLQPAISQVVTSTKSSCDASKCGNVDAKRVATKYAADVETGGLVSRFIDNSTGLAVRSLSSALLVPTQADQPTVFVNQKGQIAVGLTAVNPERGATNVGMSDAIDPTSDYGFVEVSETLHACRHAASSAAAVCNK